MSPGAMSACILRDPGWKTVPVIFLDLSVEQSRLLNLALNRISGEWDLELLARMLADPRPVEDIDLSLSGFTQEELGKLLKSLDVREKRDRVEAFDVDAALKAAQAAPVAKRGDLWRLLGETPQARLQRRDQGDVWNIPRPAESELHPTMKPLALVERAIVNSSRPGDIVLDLFLGSGGLRWPWRRASPCPTSAGGWV